MLNRVNLRVDRAKTRVATPILLGGLDLPDPRGAFFASSILSPNGPVSLPRGHKAPKRWLASGTNLRVQGIARWPNLNWHALFAWSEHVEESALSVARSLSSQSEGWANAR